MRSTDKKDRKVSIITVIVIIIVAVRVLSGFPVIKFNDKRILVYSFDRMVAVTPKFDIIWPREDFKGTVIGNHVLETEYGQITLRNSAGISAYGNWLTGINIRNFRNGLASHNLVIEGIEIPSNAAIAFNVRTQQLTFLALEWQEIIVSGIPLTVNYFRVNYSYVNNPLVDADIVIIGTRRPLGFIITLADTTQIHRGEQSAGRLNIYKASERWRLEDIYPLPVKLPGATEFTMYRTVTFKPNWGEFIEGEPWEE